MNQPHLWRRGNAPDAVTILPRAVSSSGNLRTWPERILFAACLALLIGCDRLDMYDQPRYEPLEASTFFKDGLSARSPVEGTIARGSLREDQQYYTGKDGDKLTVEFPAAAYWALYDRNPSQFAQPYEAVAPAELRRRLMERGRERFEIYCSVCHGQTGEGDGMIVRRGFRRPPSFHSDRLRQAVNGHFFDVISHGFGAMSSYASRIEVADRWAIVAYLRALQLSQNAPLEDLPDDERSELSKRNQRDQIENIPEEPAR